MASNIFNSMKPDAKVQRNAFDLSQRHVFSTKSGLITTPFTLETMPNQECKIDLRQIVRTQPLETAAFTRFKMNYDFFFVPYNQLYSSYNQWVAMRKDAQLSNEPDHNVIPSFNLSLFLSKTLAAFVHDYFIASYLPNYPVYVEEPQSRDFFYYFQTSNFPWTSPALDVLRNLDLLGYGNYLPVVKSLAQKYLDDIVVPEVGSGFDEVRKYILLGYLDNPESGVLSFLSWYFRLNISNYIDSTLSDSDNEVRVVLWPFLAQWKVFENIYRNSYYDSSFNMIHYYDVDNDSILSVPYSYGFDYVKLFNLDDCTDFDWNVVTSVAPDNYGRLISILSLPYHQYKKDMFTGVLPSTQFGDVSVMTDNRAWMRFYVKSGQTQEQMRVSEDGVMGTGSSSVNDRRNFRFDPALAISVLNQRRANALQHFNENLMRAGDKTQDVFKAHWGSEPKSSLKNHCIFIGSYDGSIDLNTVEATAASDNHELGQLASNGVGVVNGKTIRFSTTDFGIIVCMTYIDKPSEYDAYGIDKRWTLLDKFDLPFPELANISLVPVDSRELNVLNLGVTTERVLGYLPRFYDRKTAVDKIHGEFFNVGIRGIDVESGMTDVPNGVFANWVTPRRNYAFADGVQWLYHDFREEDSVFSVASSPTQETDHFLINAQFDVVSVVPLTVIGLPMD